MADGAPRVTRDPETGDLILMDPPKPSGAPTVNQSDHWANLVEDEAVTHEMADALCVRLTERISDDDLGRMDWLEQAAEGTKLLGIGPEPEADTSFYEHADTSTHPLMLTTQTRFHANSIAALQPEPTRVCRAESAVDVKTIPDLDARMQAQTETDKSIDKVERFYAHYLLEGDIPYRTDLDGLIYEMGLSGSGFRKIYNDHSRKRRKTRVEWVKSQNLIFSYDNRDFRTGRITEVINMPTSDLIRRINGGVYKLDSATVAMMEPTDVLTEVQDDILGITQQTSVGGTHLIYEVYTNLFLAADPHPEGLARPYVITIHQPSQSIMAIRRNWSPSDPDEMPIPAYAGYIYFPSKRATMGLGISNLMSNITRALRNGQRRGLEAGYLQNHPFGYKLASMKIRDDSSPITPGSYVDVDSPTNDIRAALQVNQFQGPSAGLIQLLDKLENNGRELGGVAAMDFATLMKAGVTAGPAMAAFEQSSEFQTGVHARLYAGQQEEFNLIHARMREVVDQPMVFGQMGQEVITPGDLNRVVLRPIMNPGQMSRQRQLLEAQALLDAAQTMPDVINKRAAAENYLRSMNRADIDTYLLPDPAETPPQPRDPVTEYGNILKAMGVAAGPAQNHRAHIEAHMAQMAMLQNSPLPVEQGDAAMASLSAHVAEHMALEATVLAASRAGIPLEAFMSEDGIPPEIEMQIAPQLADAMAELQQMYAPQQQTDNRVEVERVKGEINERLATLKGQQERELEALKAKHAQELQAQRDDAALDRAIQDDETAKEIAGMPNRNTAPTRAGGISR